MMERNALVNAQSNASQVEILVNQAIRASPPPRGVQPLGRIDIARGSLLSDVFFDNIFSDIAFHNKIKQSAAQVVLYNQRLKGERDNARRRVDAIGAQLVQASKNLDRCRRELYDFRKATFESYVAQNPPPPSYDIVTTTEMKKTSNNPDDTNYPNSSPPPLDAEKPSSPLTTSPPRNEGASSSSQIAQYAPPPGPPPPPMPTWGSRNPYAAAMAERTEAMSID